MSTVLEAPQPTRLPPHAIDSDAVMLWAGASSEQGLSTSEAQRRLHQHGPNALAETPPTPRWRQLAEQFREPVVYLLVAAAVIAAVLGEWLDTGAIAAIVILNALLGYFQQQKAEKALKALQQLSAPTAKVWRDGVTVVLPTRDLVVGDCLEVEAGDQVPADARLIQGFGLQALESPLTGESTPVEKNPQLQLPASTPLAERANMVFMGAVIATGKARAVVVATGMQTELGRIAQLLNAQPPAPTPLQLRLVRLGRNLALLCLALTAILFLMQLARGGHILENLHLAVSLAVAAIPEGLPAAVTITLAVGLERLVRRNAIIRKLASVETLGSVTVICSDKTGTLTRNEMTVREIATSDATYQVTGSGYEPVGEIQCAGKPAALDLPLQRTCEVAAWCNHAQVVRSTQDATKWVAIGDPTEAALVVMARKAGIETATRGALLDELPFDSNRKTMSVIVRPAADQLWQCSKGAPEAILGYCAFVQSQEGVVPLTAELRAKILQQAEDMAGRALRVLALAYRNTEGPRHATADAPQLIFSGLVGMIDPPRDEAKVAVARCRTAGIRPVMITGDHPQTALTIGRELGIAQKDDVVLLGAQLDQLSDGALSKLLSRVSVFARVTAEHKLRLVCLLKLQGHVVAMTGDGVNDAPAVKAADIGVAMGVTGTDVTKQASAMVLADDNFATIVHAVEEGRGIYDNIQKFVHYLLAGNTSKIIFMFSAVAAGSPAPLLAAQLLWLNLVTDGLPALGLGVEPPERGLMQRPPRRPDAPLISARKALTILAHGALSAAAALIGFYGVYASGPERLEEARVVSFCILAFSQLGFALSCRSEHASIAALGLFTNRPLLVALCVSLALQLTVVLVPWLHPVFGIHAYPTSAEWLMIAGLSLLPTICCEIGKWLLHGRQRKPSQPQ